MLRLIRRTAAFAAAFAIAVTATAGGVAVATVAALPLIAEAFPLELSRVTLTDGRRRVEVQGMAHLATPEFYRGVEELVAARRAEGWLVFYEEIRNDIANPAQGVAEVLDRVGAKWTPSPGDATHPYETMSPMLSEGLTLQNNRALLGSPGPEIRNVDVSMSELLAAMPAPAGAGDADSLDLAEARRIFEGLPGWAKDRVRAAAQILLSVFSDGDRLRTMLPEAITVRREALVAEAILAEPGRDILILYGQAHVSAIRQRLEAADPRWRVVAAESVRAF